MPRMQIDSPYHIGPNNSWLNSAVNEIGGSSRVEDNARLKLSVRLTVNSILRLTLLVASLPVCTAAAADDPGKDFPIQLFLQGCVSSYARESEVASQSMRMGLTEIKGEAASKYLNNQLGRVWRGVVDAKEYAVAFLQNRTCTVFVHNGNGARIRAGVESWLPPADTGIEVTRTNLQAPAGLTSVAYFMRGGKINEQWVLTIASSPDASLRAMITYESQ